MARKTYYVYAAGGIMQGGKLVPQGAEIELDDQVGRTLLSSRAIGTKPPAKPPAEPPSEPPAAEPKRGSRKKSSS